MTSTTKLVINIDEAFQHLPRAPIVEAVIDIRAHLTETLEESLVKPQLEARLRGYHFLDSQREIQIQHDVDLGVDKPSAPIIRDLGWKGLRFQSKDKNHIAQFNRDGFVFSRLEPYENWQMLFDEASRLWRDYVEVARPVEIARIGLRFINRIQLPLGEMRFEDYFESAPATPIGLNLPFLGFMHQDMLAVPGHPYAIKVIRTIQPAGVAGSAGFGLILDIDVFTIQGPELDQAALKQRLLEMRWLKNKVFFGSVTPKALELFI